MVQYIVTPWRNRRELLEVREQIYRRDSYKEPDMRRKACNMITAWKIRGNLPHAVESTANLTDAILHDNLNLNSSFSIRATYSTAFCRFVTGLTDSNQNSSRKRSMLQIGKEIDLPPSFVDVRHQAIHEDLPTLVVWRRIVGRALEWLWEYYWRHLEGIGDYAGGEEVEEEEEEEGWGSYRDVDGLLVEKQDDTPSWHEWKGPWIPKPIGTM